MNFCTKDVLIPSVDNILDRISEQDVFKFYVKEYDGSIKKFCSKLRVDKVPSVSIKQLQSGRWIMKDFGTGDCYTCFDYVQAKYDLDFYSSLKLIIKDLELGLTDIGKISSKPISIININSHPVNSETKIRICPIDYTKKGLDYWNEYNINKTLLKEYKVKQISHYYINDTLISIPKKELGFSYSFGNNQIGRYKYKILRIGNDQWKWCSNCNSNILQGFEQLPDESDLLFLTSSLKDVMSLKSLGFTSCSSQSENTTISDKLINQLKKRFKQVILFLNNDLPGLKAAEYQSKLYDIPYIYFPICCPKDPSDCIKIKGIEFTLKMINRMINNLKLRYDYTKKKTE